MAVVMQEFPILRLPRELRDEVYRYTFGESVDGNAAVPLLSVSKQIHSEAKKILLQETTIALNLGLSTRLMAQVPYVNSLSCAFLNPAHHLYLRGCQMSFLRRIANLLKHRTDLKTLEISFDFLETPLDCSSCKEFGAFMSNRAHRMDQMAPLSLIVVSDHVTFHTSAAGKKVTSVDSSFIVGVYNHLLAIAACLLKMNNQTLGEALQASIFPASIV
ncbi:hypothetical protein EJ08DRAFT_698201 [Tothia fuscella]|uniref:Uncharacterized protein n=1 Tax=Tothia fuscella TaxID=1048955 RepID=A0A9P4NPS7_9PEZI|nr:hypothetical protein EJ08DRAFT_698201 [Tothia fuscella]